jgi:hypothetical protein
MKRLGSALMALGVLVGVGAALWVAAGLERIGLPWLVALGLVKLTIVASFGLMAAGAVLVRVARRTERGEETRRTGAELDDAQLRVVGRVGGEPIDAQRAPRNETPRI